MQLLLCKGIIQYPTSPKLEGHPLWCEGRPLWGIVRQGKAIVNNNWIIFYVNIISYEINDGNLGLIQ